MENILAQLSNLSVSAPSLDSLDPATLKIILGAAGVFLFLILFAFTRRHLIHTSLRGLWAGLFIGTVLVLGIEAGGYYVYKNYVIGTKTRQLPANFQVVVNDTTQSVTHVLGAKIEKQAPSAKDAVAIYKSLDAQDAQLARSAICQQEKKE